MTQTVLPALSGARVLLVEDDFDSRDIFAIGLTLRGAIVTAVGTVAEARAQFAQNSFEIVVSDIGLPDSDGYALIGAIRSLPPERGGKVPAIAVTAYTTEEDRERSLAAGFQMHLAKPVEIDRLAASIAVLTNRVEAVGQLLDELSRRPTLHGRLAADLERLAHFYTAAGLQERCAQHAPAPLSEPLAS